MNKKEALDNPIIRELELSYTHPKYWWERTLPIGSKKWKELRQIVLKRDNETCRFCGIKLAKYMIIDHINGDATDNDESNLGLNCPACDAIRHCGLATINEVLIIRISNLSQVEIVQKTHQFYLKNGRIPNPDEIDEDSESTEWKAIEVAETKFKSLKLEQKRKIKKAKAFFSKQMSFDYLKFKIWEINEQEFLKRIEVSLLENNYKGESKIILQNNGNIPEFEFTFLSELNDQQKEAVLCSDNKICVIAGPGCGKTKTLISRVVYLLKSKKSQPSQILLLTFSKKAIREIKERIKVALGNNFEFLLNIFNIHSFCYRFLRENINVLGFENNNFPIYDSKHQEELIKKILEEEMDLALSSDKKEIRTIISQISLHKLKNLKDNNRDFNFSNMNSVRRNAALLYQKYLDENKILDFTDLLVKTYIILKEKKEIRDLYQEKFNNILVDEFQDVNDIQWDIINILRGDNRTLFLVGDPNQSIYGFQGASPNIILKIQKDECWTNIFLNLNYRSSPNIIKVGNNFLSKSEGLIKNFLRATKTEGDLVKIHINSTNEKIVNEVVHLNKIEKINLNEIAIIYRSNYLSGFLESKLLEKKIPYEILGAYKFIEREEIRDILAYLNSVIYQDDLSILRVFKLVKKIGNTTVKFIKESTEKKSSAIYFCINDHFGNNKKKQLIKKLQREQEENINDFINSLNYLKEISYHSDSLSNFLKKVLREFSYYSYLENKYSFIEKDENIQQLFNILRKWEEKNSNFSNIREATIEFLSYLTIAFGDFQLNEQRDNLILATVHQVKGLEFKVVLFVYLDNFVIPNTRSIDIFEERRIFYVGITRAKEKLYLVNVDPITSIFLNDIKK